ncbi:unnamed protein product [Arctogadus glacialis]
MKFHPGYTRTRYFVIIESGLSSGRDKCLVEAVRPLGYLDDSSRDGEEVEPVPVPDCNWRRSATWQRLPLADEQDKDDDDYEVDVQSNSSPQKGVCSTSHLDLFSKITESNGIVAPLHKLKQLLFLCLPPPAAVVTGYQQTQLLRFVRDQLYPTGGSGRGRMVRVKVTTAGSTFSRWTLLTRSLRDPPLSSDLDPPSDPPFRTPNAATARLPEKIEELRCGQCRPLSECPSVMSTPESLLSPVRLSLVHLAGVLHHDLCVYKRYALITAD